MEPVPSIFGNRPPAVEAKRDAALRKRATTEAAMREAAISLRARAFWTQNWQESTKSALPTTASNGLNPNALAPVAKTGAVYAPLAISEDWSKPSLFGIRRDRLLFYGHAACAILHLVMFLLVVGLGLQSEDQTLDVWRQRFRFTLNNTLCGIRSNFTEAGETPIVAVLVNEGTLNVTWATAWFFGASFLAHLLWVVACLHDPLGNYLLVWLNDCFAPTRWLEYTISSSLMIFLLLAISGGRNFNDLFSVWILMATTCLHGLLCEHHSRPDPTSNGELWMGQNADGSNRVRNWLSRCLPHLLGWIPYTGAWLLVFRLYTSTLSDISEQFGDEVGRELPAYILTAVTSTYVIFSLFSFVQLTFQFLPPKRFWASELYYCALSASSKLTLGLILVVNLISQERARDGAAG